MLLVWQARKCRLLWGTRRTSKGLRTTRSTCTRSRSASATALTSIASSRRRTEYSRRAASSAASNSAKSPTLSSPRSSSHLPFPRSELISTHSAYQTYSFQVIPNLGHLIAADRDSYQYLVESIERFPTQERFAEMIREAGFVVPPHEPHENLTFGVAAIHTGCKL
mgnify:FL=1